MFLVSLLTAFNTEALSNIGSLEQDAYLEDLEAKIDIWQVGSFACRKT